MRKRERRHGLFVLRHGTDPDKKDILSYLLVENFEGEVLMRVLKVDEYTLLELAACKPLSYVPCNHRPVVERLVQRGLLLREHGQWYPTRVGLAVLGRALH